MSLGTMMIHTVEIQTLTETKSATGGTSQAWSTIYSAVPACVEKANDNAVIAYGRLGIKVTNTVYLPTDYQLGLNSRIVINGEGFEVRKVNNVANRGKVWEIAAEKKPL